MREKSSSQQPVHRKKTKMTLAEFSQREMPLMAGAVNFCSNLPMSLYADTTVVKSPEVAFRGLVLSENRLLGEEFLLNFRRSEAEIGLLVGTNNYTIPTVVAALAHRDLEEDNDDLMPLPEFENVREPLGPLIRCRRSVRRYSGKPVSLRELSTLLFHSGGITGHTDVKVAPEAVTFCEDARIELRAAASGGALYPVDLYVLAINVSQLPAGAYRYVPKSHSLKPVGRSEPLAEMNRMAQFHEIEVGRASFMLCYVYKHFENARKYGEAAMGFAFIEVGAIAAHVHLVSTALGFGSCDVGNFSKRRFERALDVDGMSSHVVHLTVVGKAE
jgi:SagB-type dehydrogenase family enzyme